MRLTLTRVWRVLPVPILVLDRMPGRLVGLCMGVFVVLRADYAGDRPTVVHELEHCKQFWRGLMLMHMVRYYVSRRYRLAAEVAAFRAELAACDEPERHRRLDEAARALANGYHIGLDTAACKHLLSCPPRSASSLPSSPSFETRPRPFWKAAIARSTGSTAR
jgi:hypothetical protein